MRNLHGRNSKRGALAMSARQRVCGVLDNHHGAGERTMSDVQNANTPPRALPEYEYYIKCDVHPMRLNYDVIPWVAGLFSIVLYYPWCYSLIDTLLCQNGGELNLWRLECKCPYVFQGTRDCSKCLVDPSRGTCGYNSADRFGVAGICKGNWTGDLCDECHNLNVKRDASGNMTECSGPCRNDLGFYLDVHGRCTVMCKAETRCNGHGVCTVPFGHCKCDDGYSSTFTYSVSQYGSECGIECPFRCAVNGVTRGRCVMGACKCEPGYTGIGCQLQCPSTSNGICNGHGYCDFDAKCRCDVDSNELALYVGDSCQYKCPVSVVNGIPCGSRDARCVPGSSARVDIKHHYASGDALCVCPAGADGFTRAVEVPHVCDCNCHGHGECSRNGCACHRGWNVHTDCRTCAEHFYSYGTGCSAYCKDDVTCLGLGRCAINQIGKPVCNGCKKLNGVVEVSVYPTSVINVKMGDTSHRQTLVLPFTANEGEQMLVQLRDLPQATTVSSLTVRPVAGQACPVPNAVYREESGDFGRLCCVDGLWLNGDCTPVPRVPSVTACQPIGAKCSPPRLECHAIDGPISCCFDGLWRPGKCQYGITQKPWQNFTVSAPSVDFSKITNLEYETPQFQFVSPDQYTFFMVDTVPWDAGWPDNPEQNVTQLACALSQDCRGYTLLGRPPYVAMLTCFSETLTGCSPLSRRLDSVAGGDTFIKKSTRTFDEGDMFEARGLVLKNEGCNRCNPNWYPSPQDAAKYGVQPCSRFCNPLSTCGQYGKCTDSGECECMQTYAYYENGVYKTGTNLDKKTGCKHCFAGYYPDTAYLYRSDFSVPPCSIFCDEEATDARSCDANKAPSGCSYCSKHGICAKTGNCSCINPGTGRNTGYFGEHCNTICRPQDLGFSSESCSGHGECRNVGADRQESFCACDKGYFGLNCNYTASRDNQYYYYKQYNNTKTGELVKEADFRAQAPSDNTIEQIVQKSQCNGGEPTLTVRYTMEYTNGGTYELFNETCSIQESDDVMSDPPLFSCCFGHNNPEYANSTKKHKIELMRKFCDLEEQNVFCNVNELVAADDVLPQLGKCSTVYCDCTQAQARFADSTQQYESQFAGPGCQLLNCAVMSFQVDKTTFVEDVQSICGRHPPDDEPGACIRGECVPQAAFEGADGMSRENATESRNAYASGRCLCRQDALMDPVFGCGRDNYGDHRYTEKCCGRGDQPYSGASCDTFCSCADVSSGTCQTENALGIPAQGMACYCREGFGVNISRALFCGDSCSTQCNGIVDTRTGQTDIALTYSAPNYCPVLNDHNEAWKTPALSKNCYEGLAPCNNHGKCSNAANGLCYNQKSPGACVCDGYNVPLQTFYPDSKIPGRPSLYTGDNCQYACPKTASGQGLDDIYAFYEEYHDILDNEVTFPLSYGGNATRSTQLRNLTTRYYDLYIEQICSGHGYCDNGATKESVYSSQCICFGDYGGSDCSKACALEELSHTPSPTPTPADDAIQFDLTQASILELSNRFGVQACGPRQKCAVAGTGVACAPITDNLQGDIDIQLDGCDNVACKTKHLIAARFGYTETQSANVINLFPMVWFKHNDDGGDILAQECKTTSTTTAKSMTSNSWEGYYTKGSGSLDVNGLSGVIRIPGESKAIEWQSKRTCDTQCKSSQQQVTDAYNGPICCETCISDWMSTGLDSYGGCETCSAFATGKDCEKCLYGFSPRCLDDKCVCGSTSTKAPCSQCTGDEYVYPFGTPQANFPVCMPCLGYIESSNSVCSGHGVCHGTASTFGSAKIQPSTQTVGSEAIEQLSASDVLTLMNEFTQCKCSDNFIGASCAEPTSKAGCNSGRKETAGGWCDCFNKATQSWYSGLYCEGPLVISSALYQTSYPTHIVQGDAVLCGGHGHVVNGQCVCDAGYDVQSGCIGITDMVQYQRMWDVCVCQQYGAGNSDSETIEACTGQMSNIVFTKNLPNLMNELNTRLCPEAAETMGRII